MLVARAALEVQIIGSNRTMQDYKVIRPEKRNSRLLFAVPEIIPNPPLVTVFPGLLNEGVLVRLNASACKPKL